MSKLSYIPPERPSYEEWVKFIGIKEMVWLYHPDGREKAKNIMENVGLLPEKPLLDLILND